MAQFITDCVDRACVIVVVDLEPNRAGFFADRIGRTIESRRFTVTAGVTGKSGKALQGVRRDQVCIECGR